MAVDPDRAHARAVHRDAEYFFCSDACAKAFGLDPDHYTLS
jgi:YHS domain-containing protein